MATFSTSRSFRIAVLALTALFLFIPPRDAVAAARRADFNGDGFDDLAIGIPGASVSGISASGAVRIIFGSSQGLVSTGSQLFFSTSVGVSLAGNDRFGAALAVGDFNFDGFDDLAIGVPGRDFRDGIDDTNAGAVVVLRGSAAGLVASGASVLSAATEGIPGVRSDDEYFGGALAAGDFDGDFAADLAIGIPGEDRLLVGDDQGAAVILHGSAGSTNGFFNLDRVGDGKALLTVGSRWGKLLATGDIQGDGFGDLVVAVGPEPRREQFGGVETLYGFRGVLGTADTFIANVTTEFSVSSSVLSLAVGDLNGDGRADVVTGRPNAPVDAKGNAGTIRVDIGNSQSTTVAVNSATLSLVGGAVAGAGDGFGTSLCSGDFDGNGRDDIAVGVPGRTISGSVRAGAVAVSEGAGTIPNVLSSGRLWHQDTPGPKGNIAFLDSGIKDAAEVGDEFGATSFCGDFNGDGFDDLAVGVPGEDGAKGAVNVLYGSAAGLRIGGNQIWRESNLGNQLAGAAGLRFGSVLPGSNQDVVSVAGLSGFWTKPDRRCAAESCSVTALLTVTNPGGVEAPPSVVEVFLSADEVLGTEDGAKVKRIALPVLAPGQRVQRRVAVRVPARKRSHRIVAVLDTTREVDELDETNNTVVSDRPRG